MVRLLLGIILLILAFLALKLIFVLLFFRHEVESARRKDPASKGPFEIVFLYHGLAAIIDYRIAHFFYNARLYFLARLISQVSRWTTGIEIHPGAKIGNGVFIDHGMGVVVGETAVIGNNVLLYQGVTLGGTGIEKGKRHPSIGDNVVIGAGAKVLGNITIGENSYIGANAVVVKDVPPNSTVVGVPGRITKQDGKKIDTSLDHSHVLDPIMETIDELEKRIKQLEQK